MQRFLKKIEKNSEKNLQLTKKCLPLQSQTKRDKVLWSLFLDGYKASWRWRRELPLGNDRLKRKDNAVAAKKKRKGSIAQLVQSVCLTSRGSGVRLPLLPPKAIQETESLFFVHPPPHPRPSATKRLFCRVHLSPETSRAKHRAGVSAPQWRRMAFLLLDEVEMAASSRQISPTAP